MRPARRRAARPPGARGGPTPANPRPGAPPDMRFTVATYNIHKGFSHLDAAHGHPRAARAAARPRRRHPVPAGGAGRRTTGTRSATTTGRASRSTSSSPTQFWHEVAYGKNAVYRHGHHGNALLSRFPIARAREPGHLGAPFESRGLLHCEIKLGDGRRACTASTCTSACSSAAGSGRSARCASASAQTVPRDAPLIIAGDFNDWRQQGRPHADRRSSASSRCSRRSPAARRARSRR